MLALDNKAKLQKELDQVKKVKKMKTDKVSGRFAKILMDSYRRI
jgi:hypothetical protein